MQSTKLVKKIQWLIPQEYRSNRGREQLTKNAYGQSMLKPQDLAILRNRNVSWLHKSSVKMKKKSYQLWNFKKLQKMIFWDNQVSAKITFFEPYNFLLNRPC